MAAFFAERFIARRISSGKEGASRGVMVRIAAASVAIGVTVMILTLAVITGFREEITAKLIGFGADVQVVNLDGNTSLESHPITRNPELERRLREVRDFKGISQFAVKGGVLKGGDAMQGVMLKGVDSLYDWSFFAANLTAGALPRIDSARTKDALVSQSLARLLSLEVGQRVEVLIIREDEMPQRDMYKICGFYQTGFEELDQYIVMTDIRNVQRINGWEPDRITGYEVATSRFDRLDRFTDDIMRVIAFTEQVGGESLMALGLGRRFPALFDWLAAHNVNAAVIVTIMLLVALLNMISALLIILLESTSTIGVLKSMGMTNGALGRVFLIRSSKIVGRGILWGNVAGLALCAIQYYTHAVKLDASGYFLSWVPILFRWDWWLALNAGTYLFVVAMLMIPLAVISRITPEKTIRYQ